MINMFDAIFFRNFLRVNFVIKKNLMGSFYC